MALGRQLEESGDGDIVLRGRTPAQTVWIDRVPEPKTAKNRVHLPDRTWDVLADPEGNEFCVFIP